MLIHFRRRALSRGLPSLLVALLVGWTAVGCSQKSELEAQGTNPPPPTTHVQVLEVDGPRFRSIEELAEKADLVAVGRVVGHLEGQEIVQEEASQEDTQRDKLPVALNVVEVTNLLKGDSGRSQLIVLTMDLESNWQTPLLKGQEVLLFLERRAPGEIPGIDLSEDYYVELGGDNGVFDLIDQATLRARSSNVVSVMKPEAVPADGTDRLLLPLASVRDAVAQEPTTQTSLESTDD